MKIKKIDIVILISCILIFGCLNLILKFGNNKGDYVRVSVNGETVSTYSLAENAEYIINGYNGGWNILVIKDGEASISDADCPDGLCIKQKAISASGETLCCLPNRVIVEVVSDKENEVDAIAG